MMRMLGVAVAAIVAGAGIADAQQEGNAGGGLDYAISVCRECHAVEAGETVSPNIKAPAFQKLADTPGMTGIALNVWLNTSHRTMPNLIIEPDRVLDLYAYLQSIRRVR